MSTWSDARRSAWRRVFFLPYLQTPSPWPVACSQGRLVTLPLFGIEGGRPDIYDFAVGGRLDVWRDRVLVFASVLLPLNRAGARADVVPLAGMEATF